MIYLYLILCSGGNGCILSDRFPMANWRTCELAAASFNASLPANTTENEGGAAVFCAGGGHHGYANGTWWIRPTENG